MTSAAALFFDVFGPSRLSFGNCPRGRAYAQAVGHPISTGSPSQMPGRDEYQPAMEDVRAGRVPFCKLDVLHRQNLDRILPRFGIAGLAEDAERKLNLAWHRLDRLGPTCRAPWPG